MPFFFFPLSYVNENAFSEEKKKFAYFFVPPPLSCIPSLDCVLVNVKFVIGETGEGRGCLFVIGRQHQSEKYEVRFGDRWRC